MDQVGKTPGLFRGRTIHFSSHSSNILDRGSASLQNPNLTALQSEIDSGVTTFVKEAADEKTLAAMMAGGLVYRGLRLGTLTLASGSPLSKTPCLVRYGSALIGLGGESATFVGVNRAFHLGDAHPSPKSFAQEWLHSAINLGALRLFGGTGEGQNPLLQHFLSDGGLVASHHLAFHAGLEEKPEGDLFTQLLRAEAMNWQMKGSAALLHGLNPGQVSLERSLDLLLRAKSAEIQLQENPLLSFLTPALAMATSSSSPKVPRPFILLSEALSPNPELNPKEKGFESGFWEKTTAGKETSEGTDPRAILEELEKLPEDQARQLLKHTYEQGKLGELLLAIEEKYMPQVEDLEFQKRKALAEEDGIPEVLENLRKRTPNNNPEDFARARDILARLKSEFLARYLGPATTTRERKLNYVKWYLGLSERGVPMEISWERFLRRKRSHETLFDNDPQGTKRLYVRAKRNPRLLDDLFQIAQVSLFLNSHRKHTFHKEVIPHFRDLLIGGKGVCAGFTCLFADFASLVGLKVYTGQAPKHVFLYTDWNRLAIEGTLFYNLRFSQDPKFGTEDFDPQRLPPERVLLSQMEWLSGYFWARMPSEFLELSLKLMSPTEDRSHDQMKLAFQYFEDGKVDKGIAQLKILLQKNPHFTIPMDGPDSIDEIVYGLKDKDPVAAQSIQDFASRIPPQNQDWMEYDDLVQSAD